MIVDDEEAARYGMRRALSTFGYNITEAGSAEAARALIKQQQPDLLLLDVNLPGMSGLEYLRELKSENGNGPLVIIVTAHGSERLAVEAVKTGAYDYLSKPFELEDLRLVVKNAAETVQLRRENFSLRRRIEVERSQRGALIGNSEAMDPFTFLSLFYTGGESGTGWLDPKYVRMVDDANRTLDPQKRYQLLAQAEKYMLDAQPVIPIDTAAVNWVKKPYVKEMYPNPGSLFAWKYVYLERDQKKWDYATPSLVE